MHACAVYSKIAFLHAHLTIESLKSCFSSVLSWASFIFEDSTFWIISTKVLFSILRPLRATIVSRSVSLSSSKTYIVYACTCVCVCVCVCVK